VLILTVRRVAILLPSLGSSDPSYFSRSCRPSFFLVCLCAVVALRDISCKGHEGCGPVILPPSSTLRALDRPPSVSSFFLSVFRDFRSPLFFFSSGGPSYRTRPIGLSEPLLACAGVVRCVHFSPPLFLENPSRLPLRGTLLGVNSVPLARETTHQTVRGLVAGVLLSST